VPPVPDPSSDPLARLEALEQIRQLVARYAVAYDARDLATLAALQAPDLRADAMAHLVAHLPAGRTFHLTAEPVITFHSPDEAQGVVLCRAEREAGEEWIVSGLRYEDRYARHDGRWYLAERTEHVLYTADVLSRP
jgi:hypothetical protein